jgi:hypothetical protein
VPTGPALRLSLAAFVCLLSLTGCGGGPDPLTRQELIQGANRICRVQTERFREIQAEPPHSAQDAVEQTGELIAVSEDALERFGDLDAPEELTEPLNTYLRARRRALGLLRRGREAAGRQNRRAYSAALDRALKQSAERQALARRLGFTECAGSGTLERRRPKSRESD